MVKKNEKNRKYDDGLIDATAEYARKHGKKPIDHIPKKKHPRPPEKDKDGKFIPE